MSKLFLVRHGKTDWNKNGLWLGWNDIDLNEEGREESRKAGEFLKGEKIDAVYVSDMKRTKQTFEEIKNALGLKNFEYTESPALKDRDYGVYAGKNKWQVEKDLGKEEFKKIHRGWNMPIYEGETLKDVFTRVVPFYEENVKKNLAEGKNVLIVAHDNSLRALIKHLEDLDEAQVSNVELETGEVHCYHLDGDGKVVGKEIKK